MCPAAGCARRVAGPLRPDRAPKLARKLTPAVVEGAQPESEPYRIWDAAVAQLFLRVQPSGIKSFNVQWSRLSSRSVGRWPGCTIDAARARARAILVEVDQHGAPLAVIEGSKPNPSTLASFITERYAPWAVRSDATRLASATGRNATQRNTNMQKLKLSRTEIAEATGESLSVINDAITAGHLKTFLVGRRRFARPSEVEAWIKFLESQSNRGTPVCYRRRANEHRQRL